MIGILNIETAQTERLAGKLESLGADVSLLAGAADLDRAAKVIIPHCESNRAAVRSLRDRGLVAPLLRACDSGRPVLALSSGMHLLMDVIHDEGAHTGLGIISGKATVFDFGSHPAARHFVLPHQGWNQVRWSQGGPLLAGLNSGEYFFFDHALHAEPLEEKTITARCNHGIDFAAVLSTAQVYAAQFLPEKSEEAGECVLMNFIRL